jgi:hypothetical protein
VFAEFGRRLFINQDNSQPGALRVPFSLALIACVNLKSNAGFLEAFDIASIAAGPRDVLSVKCVRIGIEKLLFCPRVMPQEVRKGGEKASTEKRLKSKPAAQPIGSGNGRLDAGFAKRRIGALFFGANP